MVTCNYKCHDMIYEFYESKDSSVNSFLKTELTAKLGEGALIDGTTGSKVIGNISGNTLNTNITSANYNATMEIFNRLNSANNSSNLFNTTTDLNNANAFNNGTNGTIQYAVNTVDENGTTTNTTNASTVNDITTYKQINNITTNDTNTNDYNNIKNAFEAAIKAYNSDIPDSTIDKMFDYYRNQITDTLADKDYIIKNGNIMQELKDNDNNSKLDNITQEEYNNIMQTSHDNIIDDNSSDSDYFKNNLDIKSYKDLDELFIDNPEVIGLIDSINAGDFTDNPKLEYFDQENVPVNAEDLNYVDYKLFKEQFKGLESL